MVMVTWKLKNSPAQQAHKGGGGELVKEKKRRGPPSFPAFFFSQFPFPSPLYAPATQATLKNIYKE